MATQRFDDPSSEEMEEDLPALFILPCGRNPDKCRQQYPLNVGCNLSVGRKLDDGSAFANNPDVVIVDDRGQQDTDPYKKAVSRRAATLRRGPTGVVYVKPEHSTHASVYIDGRELPAGAEAELPLGAILVFGPKEDQRPRLHLWYSFILSDGPEGAKALHARESRLLGGGGGGGGGLQDVTDAQRDELHELRLLLSPPVQPAAASVAKKRRVVLIRCSPLLARQLPFRRTDHQFFSEQNYIYTSYNFLRENMRSANYFNVQQEINCFCGVRHFTATQP